MTSIIEIYKRFPTQDDCLKHLEKVRWGDDPMCPYCGADTVCTKAEEDRRSRLQCWSCRKSFSCTVGTIFHNSHIDLQRWFLLISLMFSAKKGLSAMQAARCLELRRPTVWSMMHRIRRAMKDDGELLSGIVEMDETYVGGKPRKGNHKDPLFLSASFLIPFNEALWSRSRFTRLAVRFASGRSCALEVRDLFL